MVEFNQGWAKDAAVLVLCVSKMTFEHNGETSVTNSFDAGAACENLALQGWLKGYIVHGMQGFNYELAKTALSIPEGYRVEAMLAVGKPGDANRLPEVLREREAPSGRKLLAKIVCEGAFSF